ncbi:MAG TPA: glycosyltransferase family 1 protein [Cyclobacteriaceae bacterium]|nr:glycosyltransferase family 1 protein [Cyclobacteriaceae bacterium]
MTANLICFSHLRWNFVYQRPQHLLSRLARTTRVFFFEEPLREDAASRNSISIQQDGRLHVITPQISCDTPDHDVPSVLRNLLDDAIRELNIGDYMLWYYSPMALSFSDHLKPELVVYDCMDELSAFKFAPPELRERERQLLQRADIVFTGGFTLYQAKKDKHHNIHPFPSSIDKQHFLSARSIQEDPSDQAEIPHPRLGFYGVVDERFDLDLLGNMADLRPQWHFVIIGPVVKIDPASLPQRNNIHYLGGKNYKDLPAYLAGWDIAIMPFAINESTRFISPTKTPEYLCGGKPVISTRITDVVNDYGNKNVVAIADTAEEFIARAEEFMSMAGSEEWLGRVDSVLNGNSWDITSEQMKNLIVKTHSIKRTNKKQLSDTNYV